MSLLPIPWASYQCNSARRIRPLRSRTRAIPLSLRHRPFPYIFFNLSKSRILVVSWLGLLLLAQWLNYPTPGIPRLSDGKPNLSAPAPRGANGKPDLSGIWVVDCGIYGGDRCFVQSLFFDLAKDLKPEEVQMTPWAAAIQAQREKREPVDDPYGYCMPPGVPRIDYSGGPFKIIQNE